jgi:hypothetical protein
MSGLAQSECAPVFPWGNCSGLRVQGSGNPVGKVLSFSLSSTKFSI